MRFMMIVKSNEASERGEVGDPAVYAAMAKYNEALVNAGVMLVGEGLHPSSKGARITFSGTKRTVTDGPFSEAKELIGGYWLIQVKSKEEAVEWARRVPFEDGVIELRQVQELSDFPPEIREAAGDEDALRARIEQQKRA